MNPQLMNSGLEKSHPYPFEKLAQLILDELQKQLPKAASYPTTRGIDALRQTIAD